jgi:hypothetical protein
MASETSYVGALAEGLAGYVDCAAGVSPKRTWPQSRCEGTMLFSSACTLPASLRFNALRSPSSSANNRTGGLRSTSLLSVSNGRRSKRAWARSPKRLEGEMMRYRRR